MLLGAFSALPALADPASMGVTAGSPHRGGTLHLTADASGGTLDPQINYTSEYIQLFVNMYDGLVTYRQADGAKGLEVVPDLAEALPEISLMASLGFSACERVSGSRTEPR